MANNKKKLTIYINEDILKEIKIKAIRDDISLSQLTENLYKKDLNIDSEDNTN